MHLIIPFLTILLLGTACSDPAPKTTGPIPTTPTIKPKPSPQSLGIKLAPASISYAKTKEAVKNRQGLEKLPKEELSEIFTELLLNKIIPYWYGTPWTFEGHTNTPQEGEIACGYFVSTTLQHLGLNINRYQLAQQNPYNEALTLMLGEPPIKIAAPSPKENIAAIRQNLAEGIHFIGFDESHVGYVVKRGGHLFLLHSNYLGSEGVMIEEISESAVFTSYTTFYLAPLSSNQPLLEKWLNGGEVLVKAGLIG